MEQNGRLPVEYVLLKAKPKPWTPVNSLCIAKLIGWTLTGNFRDLELAKFTKRYSMELLVELEVLDRPLNTRILSGIEDAVYPRVNLTLQSVGFQYTMDTPKSF